ncbi:MAG: SDR family NAD(P)-dependent oxidoreductase [Segniliparus sp.]|uniref:SDR family NAD(P)-dependent oxidoreductase n=1 Tax=Segniliparus sp. TaxID=2804064 RepID=UPI003F3783DE
MGTGPVSRGVLVTGASGGIGRAVARAFAELGDRVCVHYSTNAAGARETLASLTGSEHCSFRADLTRPDETKALVDSAETALHGIDVLVNNAGLAPTATNAHPIATSNLEHWVESWRTTLDVTLIGTATVTHQVVQKMVTAGRPGHIVSVGSRGAYRGEPEHPAYGAAKSALHAMTQSLALDLAPKGIAVTAVAPGLTETERTSSLIHGGLAESCKSQSPFGRVGTPEEVASAVVYLASPSAQWTSGAILDINGASYFR